MAVTASQAGMAATGAASAPLSAAAPAMTMLAGCLANIHHRDGQHKAPAAVRASSFKRSAKPRSPLL
jgi:hypothetical protein